MSNHKVKRQGRNLSNTLLAVILLIVVIIIGKCFLEGTIKNLQVRTNSGATIVGIKTKSGEYIFNPAPDVLVSCDDKLFVLGSPSQISKLKTAVEGK